MAGQHSEFKVTHVNCGQSVVGVSGLHLFLYNGMPDGPIKDTYAFFCPRCYGYVECTGSPVVFEKLIEAGVKITFIEPVINETDIIEFRTELGSYPTATDGSYEVGAA